MSTCLKHAHLQCIADCEHCWLQAKVSPVAKDLISRLLCDADHRIGSQGGAPEIKVCACYMCRAGTKECFVMPEGALTSILSA